MNFEANWVVLALLVITSQCYCASAALFLVAEHIEYTKLTQMHTYTDNTCMQVRGQFFVKARNAMLQCFSFVS